MINIILKCVLIVKINFLEKEKHFYCGETTVFFLGGGGGLCDGSDTKWQKLKNDCTR
jgi:hypothetical protein